MNRNIIHKYIYISSCLCDTYKGVLVYMLSPLGLSGIANLLLVSGLQAKEIPRM